MHKKTQSSLQWIDEVGESAEYVAFQAVIDSNFSPQWLISRQCLTAQ